MAGKRDQPSYDDEVRAKALELADEVGAAEAARRLDIPVGTVKSWRSRSGRVAPPKGAEPIDWAHARRTAAADAWQAMSEALASLRSHLEDGQPSKAQSSAVVLGILHDKVGALVRGADEAEAHEVRIAEAQGQLVAAAMRAVLVDLGAHGAGRPLIGHYLRQASVDGTVVEGSAPGVARARDELETEVLRRVSDEALEREVRRRRLVVSAQPALPSGPADEDEDLEVVEADGVVVDEGRDQEPGPSRAEVLEALRDPGRVVISEY